MNNPYSIAENLAEYYLMDKKEFLDAVNPFNTKLYRFALRLLGTSQEAEDAVQDTLEKLWVSRKKLQKEKNIEAFSMKTLKNICIDKIRKNGKKHNAISLLTVPTVEIKYEDQDIVNLLKARMQTLPIQQKMIIELKDFQGFSYEEMSEILNMPVNTIRVNLSRARKKLITPLKDEWK